MGDRVLRRARRRRQRRHAVGPSRRGRRRDQRASARTPSTSRASSCPRASAPRPTPTRRRPTPTSSCSPCPRRRLRANLTDVGAADPGQGRDGLADEGRRARLAQADERGDRRGDRRRARADRRRQRTQPGQGDRPPRAGRVGGRVRRRGRRPPTAGPVPHRRVPPVHLHGRAGLRDRRRLQERRRPRRRHGGRTGLRRQHDRLPHHPRPRRDRPSRDGPGRQPADPDGPRRARRPRGHLLVPALAQPHLRREPRQGHDHRGDLRLDPPGRGGRQVLQVAAGPGPRDRRRRPDRRARRRGRRRPDHGAGDDERFIARDTKAETD